MWVFRESRIFCERKVSYMCPVDNCEKRKLAEKLKNRIASGAVGLRQTGGAKTERV